MAAAFPGLTPNRARRTRIHASDHELAALHGVDDTDPMAVALLVPGYTGSKEDFAPLIDPLVEAGIETVAVDLPGQYESRGPLEEPAYRPEPLGAVVASAVRNLGGKGHGVVLLGHSYGGLVARAAVLAGAPVAGLTLLDSGPASLPDGERRNALDTGEPIMRQYGIEAAQRIREARDAGRPGWKAVPVAVKDFLRARFLRSSPAGLLGMAAALRDEPDRTAELATALHRDSIRCSVVCGEHDDAWSVDTQRQMAERLGARFAVIEGAGHSPNMENPSALVAELIETWRSWAAH